MVRKKFLHEHEEFEELIRIVSDELTIVPQLVEKDYWIMHCLWGMQAQGLEFEMKGGTSLSKGFQIINRFSEDIDIRISPPAGMEVKTGKSHDKPAHIKTRENYFKWLQKTIKIPGIASVDRDTGYDDEILRNAGLRLIYKSHFPILSGVKDGVLLEVGFDDTAPNRPVTISSWGFDRALGQKVAVRDNRAVDVKCYAPEYTFVEKLQTISTKFRKQQETGSVPTNFMRHYYDVYQLLGQTVVQKFIGTEIYEARKRQRFRTGDNLKISENEAFILSDPRIRALYQAEYKKTYSLYYKGQVEFLVLLKRIEGFLPKL
ncbi:nucleotidyl transferase AbiEii/AbiGii toxin family protein [Bdellovibrionota bacterium FG-1]